MKYNFLPISTLTYQMPMVGKLVRKCQLFHVGKSSVQLLSHVRLFQTPCKLHTPGLPVQHQLPESTQTHVHQVGDAIQPSQPLLSPSPPALNLSQHQGIFK